MSTRIFLLLLALISSACAPMRPAEGPIWRPSPNFDDRRPNFVILHQTTNATAEQALRTLTDPARKVSSHYLIGRDGAVFQLVDERQRAWHAGQSWWGGNTDLNSSSIGIELDNTGDEPFPEVQIASLLQLLAQLRDRHQIPAANVIGHADIAPRRKVDPSRYFPWRTLAQHGFGLWCDAPGALPPPGFDPILGLQAVGYDVADPHAATLAFRRHFLGDDSTVTWTPSELALLHCLAANRNTAGQRPEPTIQDD